MNVSGREGPAEQTRGLRIAEAWDMRSWDTKSEFLMNRSTETHRSWASDSPDRIGIYEVCVSPVAK